MSNGNETAKGMGRRRGPMGGRGMAPGEKPKDLKGAIGKLASYIRHFKFAIVIVAVFAACSTVNNRGAPAKKRTINIGKMTFSVKVCPF